ncbi:sugar phosphate isomerase/epimerase family protein [Streptosporangium saharense]|uniref:sugar phosphate isomerase/epimerase family protein n=1 Tax=Streptosporangium saharense TaxID=1706840 RepID=UPI00344288B5
MPAGRPLTLCAMTLRGATFAERVRAAALAGFDSVGLSLDQYRRARHDGLGDAEMRGLVEEYGLRVAEVETPWDWTASLPNDEEGELLFRVLDLFGCPQFNAVWFVPRPEEEALARFSALCRRAAGHGVTVALEFMPFSELPALRDAWEVVSASGEPNAAVLLDGWHHHRSGDPTGLLARIPADRIASVQLNDALPEPEPDAREEARHRRLLPGEGAIPLAGLLATLRGRGVRARMSAEIWSDALEELPPDIAARRVFEATCRVLDEAGWPWE